MSGDIMTISRLRMGTDGAGISTLVTFFDCPLHCKYCANDYCHGAGQMFGKSPTRAIYTPEQLITCLQKDEIYYLMSGGGIVFGGGEPLLQSAFIHEVCKTSSPEWKKRIETSLHVPWANVEPVLEDFDEWIIDVKDMNKRIYKKYTGGSFSIFYDNLRELADRIPRDKLHLRVPRIPDYNTEEDVQKSVKKIRERFGIEAEIFDYVMLGDPDCCFE